MDYIDSLKKRSIAEHTSSANEQHYEVSAEFFHHHLGARKKYSCCYYPEGLPAASLDIAEEHMLELYCKRAQLEDGLRVLDLGCGWGSLCLYLAEKYPKSHITALSNSNGQRKYIEDIAKQKGLVNLSVITADISTFDFKESNIFDRVMSIEMFEHMKNYERLLEKISSWLRPGGKLFVHIFVHKDHSYDFDASSNWMAKHFFTGGTMPSLDLLSYFQKDVQLVRVWYVNGNHYAKTCEAWLSRLDAVKSTVMPYLVQTYGSSQLANIWFNRWRIFYLTCAEFFALGNGQVWGVAHYLFVKNH